MYAIILFLFSSILLANDSYNSDYKPVLESFCFDCKVRLNNQDVSVSFTANINENKTLQPQSIEISGKKYKVEDASDFPEKTPFQLLSIDLNGDGHQDLAFRHIVALKNTFLMYFLYDEKSKSFNYLGMYPELIKAGNNEFVAFDYSGPTAIEKKYILKEGKLVTK